MSEFKAGQFVFVAKDCYKSKKAFGDHDNFYTLNGTIQEIQRIYGNTTDSFGRTVDGVIIDGCYFHPDDLTLYVPKKEKKSYKFDPKEIVS